jgi:hypothetical protein
VSQSFLISLTATILVPLAAGAICFRSLPAPVKVFFILIAVGAINETAMISLALSGYRNLFTLHIYTFLELVLLAWFYHQVITEQVWRHYIKGGVVLIIAFALSYAFYGENLYGFNSFPRALESLFIISLAIWLFYEKFLSGEGQDPAVDGLFFLNGGVLFYFASSCIVFAFSRFADGTEHLMKLYYAHSFVNAFTNLVFAYGIWISSRSYSIAR